ncbi:aminoglycoside phosphotransferase family protein [Paracoccus aestuarii]|uniref:Aminoglycoside phosphotransferase family protein n=1 Tax=Paracoccus aestuarii TaxID=453842 RepID=A0A418ZT35_9RHOB|nr:phosphotransferase [Paracoccus aestuarii]RJL00916.1 aminoglycoside phosphotransferase family protein [Paracoccus aestuarii]WCR00980.1 aminoglycoside phosphotransferase family protein [Paracoccus aestuarii]
MGRYAPLSERGALAYALREGLIATVAGQDLLVAARHGRNSAFILRAPANRPGLFLKQARDGNAADAAIGREARLLLALEGQGITPPLIRWDESAGIICVAEIEPAPVPPLPRDAVRALASALARLHRLPPPATQDAVPPLVTDPRFWHGMAERAPLFADLVRQAPGLAQDCMRAGAIFRRSAMVHGDAKVQNLLMPPGRPAALIDLELGGAGDPAWDIGCMIADALMTALLAASDEAGFEQAVQDAADWTAAGLAAYGTPLHPRDPADLGRMAALACVTSVFTQLQGVQDLTRAPLSLMQMAIGGLADPAGFWAALHAG